MRCALLSLFLVGLAPPAAAMPEPGPPPGRGPLRDGLYAGEVLLHDTVYVATSPLRLTGRQALVWGGLLATTLVLYNNDQSILDAVQDSRDRSGLKWFHEGGEFFEPVGHMGVMNKFYFAGLAVSYGVGSDKATRIFGEIIAAHLVAGLGKVTIQAAAGRTRPHQKLGARSWGHDDATSFPSGHAINIFELATVLSHHADRPWFTVAAYGIAAAVGVQRVASDAHWPSDVFLSAAFGTAVARCVVNLHENQGGPRPVVTSTGGGPSLGLAWKF